MLLGASVFSTAIYCFAVLAVVANHQNTAKISRIQCYIYGDLLQNASCEAKPINRNRTIINSEFYLARQIDALSVLIRFNKKFTIYRQFLINVKENFCHYFSKQSSTPYTNMLMKLGAQYTNVNHSCPYNGHIYVKNLILDASKLRDFWPSGEYRVDVNLLANNDPKPCALAQAFFEIKEILS